MWIFMSDAFFSIVTAEGRPDHLTVRARFPSDIRRVFGDARVRRTPRSDYRYRAVVPRAEVAAVLSAEVRGISYPNFKDSVSERPRAAAYGRVWTAMYEAQDAATRRRRRPMTASLDPYPGLPRGVLYGEGFYPDDYDT